MRLLSFSENGRVGIAAGTGTTVHGLIEGDEGFPGTLPELIAQGTDLAATGRLLIERAPPIDLAQVRLLPPVNMPSKIICVGLNYEDHLKESGLDRPDYPELFARFASSLVAHGDPILLPPQSDQLDFETELAVVIGKPGHRIAKADALDHVAGYSAFNDATIRDYQMRTSQWTVGKNFDATGAFGPWLVTPDALPPGAKGLKITGRLNGEVMQESDTGLLIFDVATLIELISAAMTLNAGDVIVTGTTGGVGFARDPKVFMKSGDRFEVEIERIGTLSNPIEAAPRT